MIKINNRLISLECEPYIIAEMSGNHNQSLDRALALVDAAANAGAHAIKLQTYTADSMTLDKDTGEFLISNPKSIWQGTSLYKLYEQAYTPWEWHAAIFERAKYKGLTCFSSPFDETAVDFLEGLNVPAFKIASFECIDIPLIRKVASTGKPIIISTGMATLSEISEAVDTARQSGCEELILLKCTSTYPASPENTNLRSIPIMRDTFGCEVGLSDHTLGIGAAVASVAFGASIIEKHFTLSRADGGVDSTFSLEPSELETLVIESKRAWQALGNSRIGPTDAEQLARSRRRSIYASKDIQKGDIFTSENIQRIRPGLGLAPKYFDIVLGKRAKAMIPKGTPLTWEYIL